MGSVNRTSKTTADTATHEPCSAVVQSEERQIGRRLTLEFVGESVPTLRRIAFQPKKGADLAFWEQGHETQDFAWTEVPHALSILFVDYTAWGKGGQDSEFFFSGSDRGSLAASLGDAIHQNHHRIHELFVEAVASRRTVSRVKVVFNCKKGDNVHGKAKRDRRIAVNVRYLPPDCVEVVWDCRGKEPLAELGDVQRLAHRIRQSLGLAPVQNQQFHAPETLVGGTSLTTATLPPRRRVGDVPSIIPYEPDRASAPTLDKKLLLDHLTGVGFAGWMGNENERERALRNAWDWLRGHPDDVYVRGMVLWSVLNTGNPSAIVKFLKETAEWLDSESFVTSNPNAQFDSEAWRKEIEEKINQISKRTVEHHFFVRSHLEDTLARAALLRWLRFQGKSSQLKEEFTSLGDDLKTQPVMRSLFNATQLEQGDSWVAAAVELASRWARHEPESGLARLCLIWFTGRQALRDQTFSAVEESSCWLERHPNHTLVRWATLWLAGCKEESPSIRERILRLIAESAKWLETKAANNDRLVRMGFLWIVGATGKDPQVRQAIAQTVRWLKANPKDDFVRVAYLLFLIRRRRTRHQRRNAIAEARKWLRNHDDVYGLTDLAVRLCESAPD